MAKHEWGVKRICQVCGKKFYDLNKSPIICPSCGSNFDINDHLKTRKGKSISNSPLENDNLIAKDIENIDDIIEDDHPDVEDESDDNPLLEINKEDQNAIADDEIDMNNDISFIDDEITEDDNSINVEINEDDKN
jgi:uncharacterized protein (TIGR02300 family)